MAKNYKLGKLGNLDIRARPSSLIAFVIIFLLLGLVAYFIIPLHVSSALAVAFIAAIMHFGSELWHNLGHAIAARSTGYPMMGILFIGPLALSRYPKDEVDLPAKIHIKRALGGPISSIVLTMIAGALAGTLRSAFGTAWWVLIFLFFDNLLVFSLGALLPLGFTDGSTILYWFKENSKKDA